MAMQEKQPHFVLFPFMAPGHMIPIIDMARLLSKRGVLVTLLITPHNQNRFKTVISRAIDSGLSIQVVGLKFPSTEVGLPEGCENFDMLPSAVHAFKFFKATSMLKDQVQELLQELKPFPSCLISDLLYPWTTKVAQNLQIPRILFHGTSCFSLICFHLLASTKGFEAIDTDTEYFVVPGLPDRIEITKAQLRGTAKEVPPDSEWAKVQEEILLSEVGAFGTVANTFEELEPKYVKQYRKISGKKLWCVGPVSLCNKDELDKAERGNKAAIDENFCLKWLNSQELSSVIYVCLGSLSRLGTLQLIELALGLEASNRPFIWVIGKASDEFKKWLSEEKFEERIKERGLLIHGWAPQMLILSHPSVGGFLTHCGWNSILEGATSGLPMITWPVFSEQFCNEKFILSVIKTGIRVGVEVPVVFGEEENVGVQVKSDDVKMVIEKLMDGGEEGEERRKRARKLGEMAKRAMEEGGSSYNNMKLLIEDVVMQEEQSANDIKLDHENSCKVVVE